MSDNQKTDRYVRNVETDFIPAQDRDVDPHEDDCEDYILLGPVDSEGLISLFDAKTMPARIGRYRIIAPIGKGGMGTIYKAEHVHLKRKVAIKVINDKYHDDESVEKWFQFETLVMGKLQHPNIVQTTDAGMDRGRRFLVMELLEGDDLSEHVKQNGPLEVEDALSFLRQAATALGFAHLFDIVHRDVKPSNLYLTYDDAVKLLDLGLAHCGCSDLAKEQPESGVVGSPCFMAPEQISGKNVDARSDMYSLGCTFYFMLTGKLPFSTPQYQDAHSVFRAHLYDNMPRIGSSRYDVPKSVERLLERMTAKRPEDRFQTMYELIDAIDDTALIEPAASLKAARRKKQRTLAAMSAVLTPLALFLFVHLSQTHDAEVHAHSDHVHLGMTELPIPPEQAAPLEKYASNGERITCPPEFHATCMQFHPDGNECTTDHERGICRCHPSET